MDATDASEDALDAARSLATRTGGTVAVSGETDLIVDAERTARVRGGSALLTKVTGGGCALGAAIFKASCSRCAVNRWPPDLATDPPCLPLCCWR